MWWDVLGTVERAGCAGYGGACVMWIEMMRCDVLRCIGCGYRGVAWGMGECGVRDVLRW